VNVPIGFVPVPVKVVVHKKVERIPPEKCVLAAILELLHVCQFVTDKTDPSGRVRVVLAWVDENVIVPRKSVSPGPERDNIVKIDKIPIQPWKIG
jgi:hypothetical protein